MKHLQVDKLDSHPNIIPYIDCWQEYQKNYACKLADFFIAMEMIPTGSLFKHSEQLNKKNSKKVPKFKVLDIYKHKDSIHSQVIKGVR